MVSRHLSVDLGMPVAAGQVFGDPSVHVAPGNVFAGIHGVIDRGPYVVLWFGLSLVVPTIYGIVPTNAGLGTASIATLAAVGRDGMDFDEFFPEYGYTRLRVGFEVRLFPRWHFRFDVAAVIGVPLGKDGSAWQLDMQSFSELEVELASILTLGLRAQAALGDPVAFGLGGALFLEFHTPGKHFELRLEGLAAAAASGYFGYGSATNGGAVRLGYRF
jgi:hypothetical protein